MSQANAPGPAMPVMCFHCARFVASHGFAAVSFTHRTVSPACVRGKSWSANLKFKTHLVDTRLSPRTQSLLRLSHANVHSRVFCVFSSPVRLQSSRAPFLSCCVVRVVDSQGAWSASPLHADLQPLICGPHEGATSLKDVVGLSTFGVERGFSAS